MRKESWLKRLLDRRVANASAQHQPSSHNSNGELWIHPEFEALESGPDYGLLGRYVYDYNSDLGNTVSDEIVVRWLRVEFRVLDYCTDL